jgi:hypothetical protein
MISPLLPKLNSLPATLPEEIDDYLSFVNRTIRNLFLAQTQQES